MTIGSLLASLTAGTLGLAALSPHAAEAGDFPSLNFIKFCLGPIRPKLEIRRQGLFRKAERRDRHRPGELEDRAGKTPKSPRLV
jgi:hypothetical protein